MQQNRVLQLDRIKELKEYLRGTDVGIDKFDGELFGRLIDKVVVRSLVEVTFVFKTGVEVKEVLGWRINRVVAFLGVISGVVYGIDDMFVRSLIAKVFSGNESYVVEF